MPSDDMGSTAQILRTAGLRVTPLRLLLFTLLLESSAPRSVPELLPTLAEHGFTPNKTSLYREMNRLIAAGLGEEVRTENRAVAYTAGCGSHHHHHLLCRQCRSMVDVQLPSLESSLEQVQRELAEREGFRGIGHELVFLGTCSTCDAHGTKEAGIASQHKNEAACKKDHS